jgi:uncharacterized damage-inducible protein DinB
MDSEVQLYLERLRERRRRVLLVLEGLEAEALNWQPLPQGTNSVFVLAAHLLGAERAWIHQMVGQKSLQRDREAEFRAHADDPTALRSQYEATAQETERILAGLGEAEMGALRTGDRGTHAVRWCILHVLEHYAEHGGQMELTRQLWENRSARSS